MLIDGPGSGAGDEVELRLLGPVEVWAQDRRVDAGQPRQRSVLAVLAAEAGRPVSVETLIDRVWGETPPNGARQALHAYITRIRQVLQRAAGAGERPTSVILATKCYRLDVDEAAVDLHRFRMMADQARGGDLASGRRVQLLRDAVRLWRGEPLSGLAGPWVERSRQAWRQQYLDTVVAWAYAETDGANPGAAVEVLTEVSERYPLTEPVTAALIRVLAAAGRPADALAQYDLARRRLSDELGTDPSTELQAAYHAVLHGERVPPVPLRQAMSPSRAHCALPADVAGFVGRGDELARLLAAADAAVEGRSRAAAIHAVDGMAGVGKTAFAIHAAHRLAARFPDGQQFVSLRSHSPGQSPVDAGAALELLLQADGVFAQQIPSGVEARAGMWRERVADKRLLLVLDDAADAAHVTPLLPAAPGCLVLITSRRKLATLPGATLLSLDTLSPPDATDLFTHRADDRALPAPDAVGRITKLCGYLPLAITLTAARLHIHPAWTVSDLADDLEQARDRLAEIASGDHAVAAAFELSYGDLPADRQRLFRRLALHPGPHLDAYVAAALDGTTRAAVRLGLECLLEHNLLTESHRGRYRFHDLIAEHARTHADSDPAAERNAALDRLFSYYFHATATAAATTTVNRQPVQDTLHPGAEPAGHPPADVPALTGADQADDWLAAERPNLVAVVNAAADRAHPAAVGIPAALFDHLRRRGPYDLALRLHHTALTVAQHNDDRAAQAHTLTNLADMRMMTGHYPAAIAHAEQANTLFQRLGNRHGQATILDVLAHAQYLTWDIKTATTNAEQASRLFQQLGDRLGQAYSLLGLARVQEMSGDFAAAIASAEHAHAFFQHLDNRRGQANALNTLARAQHMSGDSPAALVNAERAHTLFRQLRNSLGTAYSLNLLAWAQYATGDHPTALINAERARILSQQLGNRHGQANALLCLGVVHHAVGDQTIAVATLQQALGMFRDVSDPAREAETLNHIGQLLLSPRTSADAHQRFVTALDIARRIGMRTQEAHALEGIGHSLLLQDRREDGIHYLRDALTIYQELNAPNAAALEAVLRD